MHPLLAIDNLTIDCPGPPARRLVDGLGFELAAGETVAVVGESGAGKSLTALAVMGLLPGGVSRTKGDIRLNGRSLHALAPEEMRALRGGAIAMIMQNPMSAFDPLCSIRGHFAETLLAHKPGLGREQIAGRARRALSLSGFAVPDAVLDIYPFQMSGGMLQRVMVAVALTGNPVLLIADEATTDLDAQSQKQVVELLRERQRHMGLGLMLVTHDLSVAASLADAIVVMRRGRVVEKGKAEQLFARPEHPYTKRLMAAHYSLYGGPFSGGAAFARAGGNYDSA